MIEEEAAAGAPAPGPAPVDRGPMDDMLSIVTGHRVMSQVPNTVESLVMDDLAFASSFYDLRGWNYRRDTWGAFVPMKEILVGITARLSGLVPPEKHEEGWLENERYLAALEFMPRQLQIRRLQHLGYYWVSKTGIGMPPRVKEAAWDMKPEDVFAEARARVAIATSQKAQELVRR